MTKLRITFCVVVLGLLQLVLGCSRNPNPGVVTPKQSRSLTIEEMIRRWEDFATPGEEHELLDSLVGSWEVLTRYWIEPGRPPQSSSGTADVKWVLGRRFLEESFTGESKGKPYHGLGLTGYNKVQKRYTSVWVDSLTTGMSFSVGQAEEAGKRFVFVGQMDDPVTGGTQETRLIISILHEDKRLTEVYERHGDGQESKVLEIEYSRKNLD